MVEFTTYTEHKFHVPRRYKVIKELGAGSYGTVCSVIDTKEDRDVNLAAKKVSKIFENPILIRRAIRELRLMRHLRGSRHIVSLVDVHFTKDTFPGLYCFQELMDWDFSHILFSPMQLSEYHIQHFFYQILKGLKYTHSANIIHRDLKPGNILVDRHGTLKIADFGLARGITSTPASSSPITNYVATRWYRAPELLLREKHYGKEVDMWAAGVILGEMYGRKPMMPGKDSLGQLLKVISLIGEPDKELVKKRQWKVPAGKVNLLGRPQKVSWAEMHPFASGAAVQILEILLQWDPSARLTVEEVLEHRFVKAVRDPSSESVAPEVFKFGAEESSENIKGLQRMLTREVKLFQMERRAKAKYN